jgi:hypothetical protein
MNTNRLILAATARLPDLSVFLQHPGSDDGVWQKQPLLVFCRLNNYTSD